ncbi:hypothetical protein B0A52_09656 [Exophiala mesophila]|uniref:PIPK domain-containing protein n=1 Tax=Exophiala mesophila TaxID=212818 RepID=A0A438MRY2_EXOME|nr:hypothetical protein B0A52_09656 [Exophiala mesophila]
MNRRNKQVARSIIAAIQSDSNNESDPSLLNRILYTLRAFFYIYRLVLIKHAPESFQNLRHNIWHISEQSYRSSFDHEDVLKTKEDMGYSGSTFFTTRDDKYLIKSIPRRFEHTFFRDDLLKPYVSHMEANPDSLLVRITDFLGWQVNSLGGLLGFAPTYHLVMENLLHGQNLPSNWETFDLKPNSYFFPERDIAGGRLASNATKSKLADYFPDKILLTREQAEDFKHQLERDTQLLEHFNAVDYSLMLVRIPTENDAPTRDPFVDPPNWRSGIPSRDGKYLFRAVILDFFWAKHKVHAKFMTALINVWDFFTGHGPMSITTAAPEYRTRFLDMCESIVEVDSDHGSFGAD